MKVSSSSIGNSSAAYVPGKASKDAQRWSTSAIHERCRGHSRDRQHRRHLACSRCPAQSDKHATLRTILDVSSYLDASPSTHRTVSTGRLGGHQHDFLAGITNHVKSDTLHEPHYERGNIVKRCVRSSATALRAPNAHAGVPDVSHYSGFCSHALYAYSSAVDTGSQRLWAEALDMSRRFESAPRSPKDTMPETGGIWSQDDELAIWLEQTPALQDEVSRRVTCSMTWERVTTSKLASGSPTLARSPSLTAPGRSSRELFRRQPHRSRLRQCASQAFSFLQGIARSASDVKQIASLLCLESHYLQCRAPGHTGKQAKRARHQGLHASRAQFRVSKSNRKHRVLNAVHRRRQALY